MISTKACSGAVWSAVVLMGLAAAVLTPSPASATLIRGQAMTLEYQATESDVIVRGRCVDVSTTFTNNNIFTTYKIAADRYLKAPDKMTVKTDPVLTVSQVGGRINVPPIEQSYPNMPALFKGEDVVLFLRSPQSVSPALRQRYNALRASGVMKPNPVLENYSLLTLNISKLTVLKNPKNGEEYVTRISLDGMGVLATPEIYQSYVEAYEAGQKSLNVKSGQKTVAVPVNIGPPVSDARGAGMEQKIRRMSRYNATWTGFENQIQSILNQSN